MKLQSVTVIIPVYNEINSIKELISRLENTFIASDYSYEFLFIDDHSTDGTLELLNSQKKSYIRILSKKGKKGKAYSIIEGFEATKSDYIAMIDADLQYPPEAISQMIEKYPNADIIVANRKEYKESFIRKFASRGFKNIFGKMLFGLPHDIQSGLKVFSKRVVNTIIITPRNGWTLDLEFLHKANQAGFVIENFDITFTKRADGASKIHLLKTIFDIGGNALRLKTKRIYPIALNVGNDAGMIGAGVGFKKRQYITHSTLSHQSSAITTFHFNQKLFILLICLTVLLGLISIPLLTLKLLVASLSSVYFADVIFNLYIILKSLHYPQEISSTAEEISQLSDKELPTYTILCPMYRESHIIPSFISSINSLDWPKDKLDVMLLLEADDVESIEAVRQMSLPSYVRTVVVPHSMPKTKPKACNYGLGFATGEYLVIYDAEDIPEPEQLKKAYLAFRKVPKDVLCLQAKLNYFNPEQNLLTRFFTAEYSLWFDITLTGLQSMETTIPLGGTSNHFRTADLIRLEGWDPFNVTEDADLGVRLFKAGYKTAIIDSTTLEEANSRVKNWIRQRSRWIKGYMQTYLVHTRPNTSFKNQSKVHALLFQLTIGGKIAFILINPLLWLLTISYFVAYAYVGPTIELLYPSVIFYMAVFSLVFGNFMFLYYFMIGCAKRGHYGLIKYVLLIPLYWLIISVAGFMALQQLIFKPHYWEKTIHGLHLKNAITKETKHVIINASLANAVTGKPSRFVLSAARLKKVYLTGGALIIANGLGNVLNLIFNSYFGRVLDPKYFVLISLIGSFMYFINIPNNALSSTIKYRSGFLAGRYGTSSAYAFWRQIRFKTFVFGIIVTSIWLLLSLVLKDYFHTPNYMPFVLFTPFILSAFVGSVDGGYLSGKLLFGAMALLTLVEPILKLTISLSINKIGLGEYTYAAIPLASFLTFLCGWVLVKRNRDDKAHKASIHEIRYFPKQFLGASVLSGLSQMTFLSLDIILAAHFLSPREAGMYAILSLAGKVVYFLGNLSAQFIAPIVSRNEGANISSTRALNLSILSTFLLSVVGFLVFGVGAKFTLPIMLGSRALPIVPLASYYAFAMMCFTVSRVFASYYLIKKLYTFPVVGFLLGILQFVLISVYHQNVREIVFSMFVIGVLNLISMITLHLGVRNIRTFEALIRDLLGLFTRGPSEKSTKKLRILIYNWRDNQHKWAGGAEVYMHELAKRWVKDGSDVTVFCGNDGDSARNQVKDGVTIIRRGGAYLVYLWAAVYYILKFRKQFDVIIDCENGIPFFTPLFTRKPVFLVIHHIHQEVFREHLRFPFSHIARFMEGKVMPLVYRNKQIITVSESSKKEIIKLGLSRAQDISVIHNGIDADLFHLKEKAEFPLLTYLGRLKPYKNIDVAIKAFSKVIVEHPRAHFAVVGTGESYQKLMLLTKKLNVEKNITFFGKVSENKKADLLAQSWIVVQPSMTEGWGITVIEANASGTPVIASNVNGLKDSVVPNKTGLLVKVKDIEAMTNAITLLITDTKLRQELSANAYAWSTNFSWDISATKFGTMILKSLESPQSNKRILVLPFLKGRTV